VVNAGEKKEGKHCGKKGGQPRYDVLDGEDKIRGNSKKSAGGDREPAENLEENLRVGIGGEKGIDLWGTIPTPPERRLSSKKG